MSRRISSSNLDALTNSELREMLAAEGFPNQPVTNTTRNVLISRLKKQMQEGGRSSSVSSPSGGGGGGPARTRHTSHTTSPSSLARYSSAEEESDRESAFSSSRRKTTTSHAQPTNMPPPAPASAAKRKRTTQQNSFFSPSSTSSMIYSADTSASVGSTANNYNLPTIKVPIQSRSSVYIPPPVVHSSDTEESDTNTGGGGGGSNSRATANPYMSYGRLHGLSFPKRYTSSNLDSSPVVLSRGGVSNASPGSRLSDTNNSNSGVEESSPYVSDFTKRLLQFRNMSQDSTDRRETADSRGGVPVQQPNPRYFYRMPNRHSVVHQATVSPSESHNNSSISSPMDMFRNMFFRLDQQYGFRQNLVPFVLLAALVLFIAFLVFMYLTISPDLVSTITLQNAKYTRCTEDGPGAAYPMIPAENCIFENDLESALDFLRLITPELQARVERHMCKDPGLPSVLTASEAIKMRINSLLNHDEYDTQRQLLNMEYLIEMNPQWHISNLNADGAAVTIGGVREMRIVGSFGILKPRLPLTCLFLRKLQTFFFIVGTLGLATVIAYAGNFLYRYWLRTKQERQQKLNRLISHILQIVMEQASNFPSNADAAAVVVNHLRDKIVDPAQRTTKEMETLWREAIVFLERNESRVQFEVGTRNGEDCRLVRWVDTIQLPSPNHRSPTGQGIVSSAQQQQMHGNVLANGAGGGGAAASKPVANLYNAAQLSKVGETMLTAKKWQSPAFDKTNKISSPPTPCLKIRQMFDKYEAANPNLRTIIADAILEKVGPTCKIYDIFLEPQACCVYVRCATTKDAGMVHDEINGWWFDNRLVSIKFLRLERFTERFPESMNNRHLLRPSNPQKLSLTQCNRYDQDDDDEEVDDEEEEALANEEEEEMNGRV